MSKSIDTLVSDIYKLLETGKARIDSARLSTLIAGRLESSGGGDALRMSNAGEKCVRKLWYRQNSPEKAEPISGPTRLKFLIGDIHGLIIPQLAEQADHKVEALEEEVEFEGVKGHIDAIIDGTLIDVKSANSRGMEKFRKHELERDDPFNYLTQLDLYWTALRDDPRVTNRSEYAFLVADKELGHLVLDKYPPRHKPWRDIIGKLKEAIGRKEPPDRYYSDEADGKSGNRTLCLQCRYCDYKRECWKDSNEGRGLRGFLYSNGLKWLTKVGRLPDVKEIRNSSSEMEQQS